MTHRHPILLWLGLSVLCALAPAASADKEQAWAQLQQLAEQAGPVNTYEADFTQEKFTPLLAQPITSNGRVRIAGGVSRWDTDAPYASTMLIQAGELRVYYPDQETLEVYRLGDRLDAMAASPVPDLARLRESFEIASSATTPAEGDGPALLRVELLPRTDEVKEAIESVTVALDTRQATLHTLSITDLDGETTTLTFRDVRINPELDPAALRLEVPAGTRTVYPLEGGGE